MQKTAKIASTLLLLVALPQTASAEEGVAVESVTLEETAASEPAAAAPSFSGFVDAGLFAPLDGFPAGTRGIGFGLGQAELNSRFSPDPGLEIGIDLNFFPGGGASSDDGLLEQGFVTWSPDEADGLSITVGKQNAPIGLESLDPADLATVSGGLVWSYGVPSNLTGLFVTQELAFGSAQLFTTAEWDSPASVGAALVGARVDIEEGPLAVGLVATHGPMPEDADPARTMANLTASYELGELTLSGEYLFATVDGDEAKGWTLLATQALSDRSSLTARIDQLTKEYGETQVDQADITLVAGYKPTPHLRALLELKQAAVGEDAAVTSLAVGVTATF